jgi:hypothetical protein
VQSVLEEHGDLKIIDDVRVVRALNSSQFTPLRTSLEKNKLRRIDDECGSGGGNSFVANTCRNVRDRDIRRRWPAP